MAKVGNNTIDTIAIQNLLKFVYVKPKGYEEKFMTAYDVFWDPTTTDT